MDVAFIRIAIKIRIGEDISITENDKDISKKEVKHKHGEFKKVLLTDKEHSELLEKFGESKTKELIERLDGYVGSTGKSYKSHYMTILNWSRKDEKETSRNTTQSKITAHQQEGYHYNYTFDDILG